MITDPSFNSTGASGSIYFSILFIISLETFISILLLSKYSMASNFLNIVFIIINESFKANISFGWAPPLTILDTILSRSYLKKNFLQIT